MDSRFLKNKSSRAAAILIGHNLPFAAWTLFAALQAASGGVHLFTCPVRRLFGWCPGCGLTTAYASLLKTGRVTSWWFALVLAGFLFNLAWSLVVARQHTRKP